MYRITASIILLFFLSGCVSIDSINEKFRIVDAAWAVENQSKEAEQQHFAVNVDLDAAFAAVRQTFIDLDMPIDKESREDRYVVSRNESPHPLSLAQWEEVRQVENPKMRELVGSLMSLPKNSKGYFVTIRAAVETVNDGSVVSIDYYLEMPKYEDMGIIPSREAPPRAVTLMSKMFLNQLNYNLARIS